MTLSFIIPAHNEESLIGPTIRAMHAAATQIGESYEIIVVDDASSDSTATHAEAAGARIVRVELRQIAAVRNAGAALARGETFVFVDADTLVTPAVIRGVVDAVRGGAVGGGAAARLDEPRPPYTKVLLPVILWVNRRLRWASGCFVFCTRQAFQAVGGFDESLFAAEEIAISGALKRQGRVVILRDAVLTSGRKVRTYSGWEILGTALRLALSGRRALRDRNRLELWYGPRRKDVSRDR